MRRTKIICTLGPTTEGLCEDLIINGMDAARVNFSHETYEIHARRIDEFKKARRKLKKPVSLIMDTKGPEIRLGLIKDNTILKNGQKISIVNNDITGDDSKISISYKNLYKSVIKGNSIYIDDGKIHLKVKKIKDKNVICEVVTGGKISDKKGVNIPGCVKSLSFLSEKDLSDLDFAIKHEFDYIALSFVRDSKDILKVREFLKEKNSSDISIISKIENKQSVENIDEIIEYSDGLMIARGDLGIEMPLSQVPSIQKKLIRKCYSSGYPVITATQMLESMTENMLPTRAEVSDVANAIYDNTSAVMLSGETACGKYPLEVLKKMVDIIETTEKDIDYRKRFFAEDWLTRNDVVSVIGQATSVAAFELKAKGIVVVTNTGNTARMISRFRPNCPIIAVTVNSRVERQLNLSWGIHPVRTNYIKDIIKLYNNTMECAKSTGIIGNGDLIILTTGMPTGPKGKTNTLKIHIVGEDVI